MSRVLTYLACPYTHKDAAVIRTRVDIVNYAAAHLMSKGLVVFSPISHSHPIATAASLPTDWQYWQRFCEAYIECSKQLIVLTVDGWTESKGIAAEMAEALINKIPIRYMDFRTFEITDQP